MVQHSRALGSQGPRITRLGLGLWAAGGGGWAAGWGPQDDRESVAAIHRAIDLGINWVDTAAVYGHGHSEEVVALALAQLPASDRPYVFTKCGRIWDARDHMRDAQTIIDPASIRRECEASLSRLGVDVIDLYQIHEAPLRFSVPVEESWGAMLELRSEGKVRWCGVSNFAVPLLERCERVGHVDSLQPPFSLISREAASELLPWCAAHETGVIAYSPMHSGLLTGSFSADRVRSLPEDDWRRCSPDFVSPQLERNLAVVDALRPIAERRGVGLGALAIAWVLSFEAVTGAIVGARSAGQVDGWIEGSDLVLTDTELDEVAAALERTGAGSGPRRPADGGAGPER